MKLAVITDCLSRNAGGVFDAVRRLAQELHRAGVGVRVFGVADERLPDDFREWQPLESQALPRRGPRFFGYAPGLKKAIRAAQPSAIEVHGLWKYTSLAVLRASAALGCPYVVHPHGMLDPWALRNSRWKKRLAAWAYERRHLQGAACLRALNAGEAEAIRAYGLRNPVCVVPNAVDLPAEAASLGNGAPGWAYPRELDAAANPFPPGRKILLYLGRIHPKKGLANLLDAWADVRKSPPAGSTPADWVLAVAGWDQGGHESDLRRRAADLRLGDSVVFIGPRFDGQKAACFRHCDAFVLPSFSEGLPMAVLEAWSYGKPVLMTPECNLPDGFEGGAALRVAASRQGIAAGLRTLLEMSDADRRAMGARGLALVAQRYTWPEVAHQMREVYDWLLGGGPSPPCVRFA